MPKISMWRIRGMLTINSNQGADFRNCLRAHLISLNHNLGD